MGADTKIEWADHTFNAWIGCAKVSQACKNCYAEDWAARYAADEALWGGARRRTSDSNWRQPLRWNRKTPGARVFCSSLSDVFECPEDHALQGKLEIWRTELWDLIEQTPALTWMLLTKRPEYAAAWTARWGCPPNVWVGTTVEDQATADERIPHLLRVPARVRFLSMEPLLGPVNLRALATPACGVVGCTGTTTDALGGLNECPHGYNVDDARTVQWVIAGGESGPRARASHPQWFRFLRDECSAIGVPYFFKQWGEWAPFDHLDGDWLDRELYTSNVVAEEDQDQSVLDELYGRTCRVPQLILRTDGRHRTLSDPEAFRSDVPGWPAMQAFRVGKKQAGRLLDGREWSEVPGAQT